jgi:hypothetical protein
MRALHWPALAATLGCLIGCLGDPVGPAGTLVVRRLAPLDSVFVGAPGRALPTAITFQVVDGDGRPVPAAAVSWTIVGTNGRVGDAPATTDARGEVSALWVLGTRAAEAQSLTVLAAVERHTATVTVPAVAKPVEVSSVAFSTHDTTAVKLGVATALQVEATDPFGNKFVPSGVRYVSLDTSLCVVDSLGSVSARKRGFARIVATTGSAADTTWVHPTQVVQQIVAAPDTVRFHSLGQTASLAVQLLDDQGLPVRDSIPVDSVAVDTVVKVQAGTTYTMRSTANGVTPVILRAGSVARTVQVVVHQRVANVKLSAGRVSLDALGDTVQLAAAISDSLGAPLVKTLTYSAADTAVVTVGSGGLVTTKGNGATWVYARAWNGVGDSIRISVAQQVARVVVQRDSIVFSALKAALSVGATAVDRLGSPVPTAALTYASLAPSVAAVDTVGTARALANGNALIAARFGSDTAWVAVRVAQRPVRMLIPADSVRFVALGDTQAFRVTAVDSLGSTLTNMGVSVHIADTTVANRPDSLTLRSRGNGSTVAALTVGGLAAQVPITVSQVPVTMTAVVTYGNPVLTLPVGASVPMSCQALDRNGFVIPQDPAFVGSVRGTVAGSHCGDTRVQRSGYDTLFFGLGPLRARVPVIVATAPDSVGVLAVAQPLTTVQRDLFVGEDLANPLILALRPLVADILAAYGNPTSNLGRARALRDWVARTAVHPHPPLHPDASTSNLSVLPPGTTWANVNALIYAPSKDSMLSANYAYWLSVGYDGYAMLDRLLGTLDPSTGLRADDGMMVHVGGARYQIRDLYSYRYPICTFQDVMLSALWAAAGLHGMLISTVDHDPAAVFIPELGRWAYEDPTFNEEYLLDGAGDPLSPVDLLTLSSAGQAGRLHPTKLSGPSFDPSVYIPNASYVDQHPDGMVIMGSQLNNRVVGIGGWPIRLVQINVPQLALEPPFNNPISYDPVSADVAFPTLGVTVQQLQAQDSVYVIQLSSTFPNFQRLERRLNGGSWQTVASLDVLPVGQCRVEYRALDVGGNVSAMAAFDVWVPRAGGFVESAPPGSVRAQAQYCLPRS